MIAVYHSPMPTLRDHLETGSARLMTSPWPWRWALVLAAIDIAWLALGPIGLAPASIAVLIANGLIASMLFVTTDSFTQRPKLGFFIEGFVFLAFTFPYLRLLNHLSMSVPLPLADPMLASWDRAIGFDWLAYLHWADDHPLLLQAMSASYSGLTGYTTLLFLLLAISPHGQQRCLELVRLFMLAGVTCMTLGLFFPAVAAMQFHAPPAGSFVHFNSETGAYHLAHLQALRGNPQHIVDLLSVPGLVTFPSFHTAMGIIGIWCARGNTWLFAPVLAVNGLMIASTPIYGSHYGIDVIGGALVAICAIAWLERAGIARPTLAAQSKLAGITSPAA